jgi:hypothetical protein
VGTVENPVPNVTFKVLEAARKAKAEDKLCDRASSALDFLLTHKQLLDILEALINIGMIM